MIVLREFFDAATYAPAAVTALVGGMTLTAIVARRIRPLTAAVLHVVCFGAFAALTALRGTFHGAVPTPRTAEELGWGVIAGWAEMLSVGLPAPATGRPLVTVLLVTWLTAAASTALALHTRAPLWPALPPMLACGLALAMVASQQPVHLVATGVLSVAIVILVVIRSRQTTAAGVRPTTLPPAGSGVPRSRLSGLRTVGYLCAVVVLGAAPLGVIAAVGGDPRRADPRPLRAAPLTVPEMITPLATVRAQLIEAPVRRLLHVELDAAPDTAGLVGIRTIALDRFDGAVWTTDQDFFAAGENLKRDRGLSAPHRITGRVTIDRLAGRFLPLVGWPRQIRFTSGISTAIGFSPRSGAVVASATLPAGATFEFVGEYRSANEVARSDRPARAGDDAEYQVLPPGIPPLIMATAHEATDAEASPVGKLAALNEYLRGLPYSLEAPPGHSYAAVSGILSANGIGYAEQHAAAFAIMARVLGFPARVAVGYRLPNDGGRSFDVTTADAHAWAEVRLDRSGWVAFDPTDAQRTQRRTPVGVSPSPTVTETPSDGTTPTGAASVSPTAPIEPCTQPDPRCGGTDWVRAVLVVLGSCTAVVALALAGIAATRILRRRRRRRRGTPADRVVGAWQESVELPLVRNMHLPPGLTPIEIAGRAAERHGSRTQPMSELSSLVTTAVFGPQHLVPGDPERAWAMEWRLHRQLYGGRRRWLRIVDRFDPRVLRSGPRRPSRTGAPVDAAP
ncbi:transglutaminaseTgpA domain-containing protein [Dactylosporangium sp. CA-092794]|uniref:transglutaminase family protein n=1 Tax=Dactylosporangium sp. CA-092794 TaxID=3239929 RepID=UPI003D939A9F